jgi:hypothetical protein
MITGIKVKLSGRLTTESVIPRVTQKSFQIGSFNQIGTGNKNTNNIDIQFSPYFFSQKKNKEESNKNNIYRGYSTNYFKPNLNTIHFSEYITKNRIGAFTIKVWISSVR